LHPVLQKLCLPWAEYSARARFFWLLMALSIAAAYGGYGLVRAFADPQAVQEDARQFVFWMVRFEHPDLFRKDLIADYLRPVTPIEGTVVLWTRIPIMKETLPPQLPSLDERSLPADPLVLFKLWYEAALSTDLSEPGAMVLTTASAEGQPSARMVLLKGFDTAGFVFFTNYTSRKGVELDRNPRAALLFYWDALACQVRVDGSAAKVSAEASDRYFESRPIGSQIGALASDQSRPIESREKLVLKAQALASDLQGRAPARPPHWGGYCLIPQTIEFWQGRADRLHDRLLYTRDGAGWKITRLQP
jgi:pyridoxamine 5'-phosphate oxidase